MRLPGHTRVHALHDHCRLRAGAGITGATPDPSLYKHICCLQELPQTLTLTLTRTLPLTLTLKKVLLP